MGNALSNLVSTFETLKDIAFSIVESLIIIAQLFTTIIKGLEPLLNIISIFFKGLNWFIGNFMNIVLYFFRLMLNFFKNFGNMITKFLYEIISILKIFLNLFNIIINYIGIAINIIFGIIAFLFGISNYAADEDILF